MHELFLSLLMGVVRRHFCVTLCSLYIHFTSSSSSSSHSLDDRKEKKGCWPHSSHRLMIPSLPRPGSDHDRERKEGEWTLFLFFFFFFMILQLEPRNFSSLSQVLLCMYEYGWYNQDERLTNYEGTETVQTNRLTSRYSCPRTEPTTWDNYIKTQKYDFSRLNNRLLWNQNKTSVLSIVDRSSRHLLLFLSLFLMSHKLSPVLAMAWRSVFAPRIVCQRM